MSSPMRISSGFNWMSFSTFVRFADLVRFTRVEKNSFRGGRLTGIDVSHDTDIASIS
jgi:hypothetical protein